MSTSTGLFLVLALFVVGVAVLAIVFFGKDKPKKFSRFNEKSGGGAEKLACWVVGLFGLSLVFLCLAGIVPLTPFLEIGGFVAFIGFKSLIPGQNGTELGPRGFLIRAWIELVLALICFGAAAAAYSQITYGYGMVIFGIAVFFLFMFGCMFAGVAFHDYLRYVAGKPLPDVEPSPEVLAGLLKAPGAEPVAEAAPVPRIEAPAKPPPEPALPGLLVGVIALSAGIWFRSTELLSPEVRFVVGAPLCLYGLIRCVLNLYALLKSFSARRI